MSNAIEIDCIKNGNNVDLLKTLPDESVDLVVTSPPYDNLRDYNGFTFDFEQLTKQLYRTVKTGGCVVWIVADATVKGSETGTSFRQALGFRDAGFNIHDSMIWLKDCFTYPDPTRYGQAFEYMFIFSKGRPKTINLIKDKANKWAGSKIHGTSRGVDGETFRKPNDNKNNVNYYGARFNDWQIPTEKNNRTGHPAVFPIELARDHIKTWSNEGDIVLDCFMGSGTTALACIDTGRHYIGFEISREYCDIAKKRIDNYKRPQEATEQVLDGQISIFDLNQNVKE